MQEIWNAFRSRYGSLVNTSYSSDRESCTSMNETTFGRLRLPRLCPLHVTIDTLQSAMPGGGAPAIGKPARPRKRLVWRTMPAVFPYDMLLTGVSFYHGQRNWLVNQQIQDFNTFAIGLMTNMQLPFELFDEWAMSETLWGFQIDGLHWGSRQPPSAHFIMENVAINLLLHLIAEP